ncbi:hypothetical protein A2U01_0109007 [Trifolium medium]|uniref:Uncharacterized protein n=1 Tax=Trifolium medium TaxID=97028 RepID=A0A392VJX1_9FABA|nr:hypothetical protein [Trifolium medium]
MLTSSAAATTAVPFRPSQAAIFLPFSQSTTMHHLDILSFRILRFIAMIEPNHLVAAAEQPSV